MRRRLLAIPTLAAAGAAITVLFSGCSIATPFRGPGYDKRRGVTLVGADAPVIVMLTNAVLHRDRRRPFDEQTRALDEGLADHAGLVGYSFRRELFGDQVWTMSAWADQDSLDAFVASAPHRRAMRDGAPALKSTRFLQFETPASTLPIAWRDAIARLDETPPRHSE